MKRDIPLSLINDRATVVLITRWRNLLTEYAVCRKRVNWNTTRRASQIEKKRRERRWEIEATLNDVENTLIAFLADATHHNDLWSPPTVLHGSDPLDKDTFSKMDRLYRRYYETKRRPGPFNAQRKNVDKQRSKARRGIVLEIANLKWLWLSSLYKEVFPTAPVPPKRQPDLRVLRPKRIRRLSVQSKQTTDTHGAQHEERKEKQEEKEGRQGRRQKEA